MNPFNFGLHPSKLSKKRCAVQLLSETVVFLVVMAESTGTACYFMMMNKLRLILFAVLQR